MAPSMRDDTTAELQAAAANPAERERPAWHDRPTVMVATAVVGLVGLIALTVSVVDMSDQSEHQTQTTATAPPETETVTPELPQTTNPPVPSPVPTQATSVPNFAAGPTAETLIPPTPSAAGPAPYQLPPWLRRLLHLDGGSG
ncbi:MAG: hypothetical protein JWR11_1742 [Mycobacterium sp.]|nr:hypothetical protein [Mycobacterium sp.]